MTVAFYVLFRSLPSGTIEVFYFAAQQSMDGSVNYDTGHGLWVYTPAALLYFYPYALLFDFQTAALVHRVLSAIVSVTYGVALVRFIQQKVSLTSADKLCIVGFACLTVYPVVNVVNASFVGMFAALLGGGWLLLESDNDLGGAAWALASIVKVYPALWGIYLLRTRRWRATAVAIVAGLGATLLGLFAFGLESYVRFFTDGAAERVRYHHFRNGGSPDNEAVTPLRALGQIFPNVDPAVWTPVLLVVLGCLTLLVYYLVPTETPVDRATLLLATILGIWFVMPTSQDLDTYIVYAPLLVLLYLERHTLVHGVYALGTVILSYNIGRGELRTVSEAIGVADFTMSIGEPILTFATMPMYGLATLYAGCLLKARLRGRETGRTEQLKSGLKRVVSRSSST
jgi:hypothetical protein